MRRESGHHTAGRKVGYANKAIWRALKLETLVWAHMYDDTVHYAGGTQAELRLPYYRSPKIEPEIVAAFGLHLALVVGPPRRVEPEMIQVLIDQLARFKLRLSKDGQFVEEG